jgi:hypothetical protein
MAEVHIERNEVPDPGLARQFEDEVAAAALYLADAAATVVECTILDEGLHAEIELELPGWTERVPIAYPPAPGAIRDAVAHALRDLGLVA